jgi:hypothetical protein
MAQELDTNAKTVATDAKATEMANKDKAREAANAAIEHPEGGSSTRDDKMDAGVPMLKGSPTEHTGPEDAFGAGPKRGNYAERQQAGKSYTSEAIPESERTPGGPLSRMVEQFASTPQEGQA